MSSPRAPASPAAPVVLRASRLTAHGFAHGFATRLGGASRGPYSSLNFGRTVGDEPECVAQNHRLLAGEVGYAPERLYEVSQVHGKRVIRPGLTGRPEVVRAEQADALLACEAGLAVGVRNADCVPVLLADPETGAAAAVHAGWRGVAVNVVAAAVQALLTESKSERRQTAGRLIAAIGPSIGPCCFEVDAPTAAALAAGVGDAAIVRQLPGQPRPRVDLWLAVTMQLRAAGVADIELLGCCTRCDQRRFFSYRRDGRHSGRMLSLIVAR